MAIRQFLPKDRTKKEHVGTPAKLVWNDPEAPACILRLSDGASVIGPADGQQFLPGQQYRFFGWWQDGRYGPEFKFQTFVRDLPITQTAATKYLAEICRGVGAKTAEKLWAKFGPDCVRLLREEPEQAVGLGILSDEQAREASDDLRRYAHIEKTRVDLFGILAGKGFGQKTIDLAIRKWGVIAPQVIGRDPFKMLVAKLPGCGFKRCDKLWGELGLRGDHPKRVTMAAWHVITEDRSGSTWVDARDVIDGVIRLIPSADPIRAIQVLIRAGWIRIRREGDSRYLATRAAADAEQRIADNLHRLNQSPHSWPAEILSSQVEGDGLPSEHQTAELREATAGPVGAFIGGPGTGKTHTLSFLIRQIVAEHGDVAVAVCAPTGKASVRARESLQSRGIGIQATTIHRLLEIGKNGHDGGDWEFKRNRNNPLEVRFVIVDESSMIDTSLMASLLDAIPTGACVLFVGDPFQLPPVGHGAPLRDLLAAGIPQGELTEVRRNSGAIVRACAQIKAGTPVEFCPQVDLEAEDKQNLRHLDVPANQAAETIEDVLGQIPSMFGFDPIDEVQVIVPMNERSDTSRTKLNEKLGNVLNPSGHQAKGNPFRVGDKIICLRNTRLKVVVPTAAFGDPSMALDAANYQFPFGDDSQEQYVANGEIGRVIAVSDRYSIVRFGGIEGNLVRVPVGKRKPTEQEADAAGQEPGATGAAADFDLAWAITVHRSQGSEWPCVICVIDEAGGMIADRNYWYTGISRARSLCVAIGPKAVFERQVKRQQINQRRTCLVHLIEEGAVSGSV